MNGDIEYTLPNYLSTKQVTYLLIKRGVLELLQLYLLQNEVLMEQLLLQSIAVQCSRLRGLGSGGRARLVRGLRGHFGGGCGVRSLDDRHFLLPLRGQSVLHGTVEVFGAAIVAPLERGSRQ